MVSSLLSFSCLYPHYKAHSSAERTEKVWSLLVLWHLLFSQGLTWRKSGKESAGLTLSHLSSLLSEAFSL